jgi:hypothetical protein
VTIPQQSGLAILTDTISSGAISNDERTLSLLRQAQRASDGMDALTGRIEFAELT